MADTTGRSSVEGCEDRSASSASTWDARAISSTPMSIDPRSATPQHRYGAGFSSSASTMDQTPTPQQWAREYDAIKQQPPRSATALGGPVQEAAVDSVTRPQSSLAGHTSQPWKTKSQEHSADQEETEAIVSVALSTFRGTLVSRAPDESDDFLAELTHIHHQPGAASHVGKLTMGMSEAMSSSGHEFHSNSLGSSIARRQYDNTLSRSFNYREIAECTTDQVNGVSLELRKGIKPRGLRSPTSAPPKMGPPLVVPHNTWRTCVEWVPPAGSHEDPEFGYALNCRMDGSKHIMTLDDLGEVPRAQFDHLEAGQTYYFQVCARNNIGYSAWSNWSEGYLVPEPPVAVRSRKDTSDSVALVPEKIGHPQHFSESATSATLEWDEPCDQGSEIMGYCIQYCSDPEDSQNIQTTSVLGRQNWVHLTGLLPNRTYYVRTQSINKVGESDWTEWSLGISTKAVEPEAPNPPVLAEAHVNELIVRWEPPYSCGFRIVHYDVQIAKKDPTMSNAFLLPMGDETEALESCRLRIVDIEPNTDYYFQIRARSEMGTSEWSEPSLPMRTKMHLPGAPEDVRVVETSLGQVTIEWVTPDGYGEPIDGFVVRWRDAIHPYREHDRIQVPAYDPERGKAVAVQVKGIIPGSKLSFQVAARTKAGLGPFSQKSPDVIATPGVPGNLGPHAVRRFPPKVPGRQPIMLLRGGDAPPQRTSASAPSLTPTKLTPPTPTERFRKDYLSPPYRIDSVSLNIDIHEGETQVISTLVVHPQTDAAGKPLDLDGAQLNLKSIEVNGVQLQQGRDYELTYDGLRLFEPPSNDESFEVKTLVSIVPEKNSQLQGLYKSGGMYVTHNEAEGFRRITYFQDRPDVMAKYDCRIEADNKYPILLSNGNEIDSGDLGNGRHWASFSDPFRKPSYLFAAVAGDLARLEDKFTTMNGREVRLNVWAEHDNAAFLDWPMKCLKDAMKWDEETYDREYDLDVYHIVAVNDFNMGAMENKGLNIFNTAAVLAKESSSTDADFERVLQVVGHEYAHNWSGNRVTVRDWFQVSLKEGFTCFREQHFCQDMTSAGVRRIEEANMIRTAQFDQDAGPMAHAVRPESYTAIDNFYTVTVYNKGSEVIRMFRTLLGTEVFRKAVNLYFERHDGSAVTCDDFRKAMADASGRDFTQFERWYMQAGTPTVTATADYEASSRTYKLTLAQKTMPTPNQQEKLPLHIPVIVGLLGSDGRLLTERLLELREAEQTFIFEDIPEEPVPSILRGFSAPVKVDSDAIVTPEKLGFLAANDDDPFNRWDALQRVYKAALLELIASYQANDGDESKMTSLAPTVLDAFKATLVDEKLDPALRAISLTLPSFSVLAQEMEVIDVDAITTATRVAQKMLATTYKSDLLNMYNSLATDEPYAVTQEQVGARRLRNVCLSYLSKLEDEDTTTLCLEQFRSANSMTDSVAALVALCDRPGDAREEALATFYERAKSKKEVLNINKWFQIQAMANTPTVLADVEGLMQHEAFDANNPNRLRALFDVFASANPKAFHKIDGSGYKFIADQVIEIDKQNPQVGARLASAFLLWKRYGDDRKSLMKAQLERIQEEATSKDTKEIVGRSLT